MRIGIDVSRTAEETTGVGYYAKYLVDALAKIDTANQYTLYGIFFDCYPKAWKKAHVPTAANFKLHQRWWPSALMRRRWLRSGKQADNFIGNVDVLHSTAYTMPAVNSAKMVVTVHDTSCLVYPEFHTEANNKFVVRNLHLAGRRADMILADSKNTKREIMRFLHVPEERIEVVHLAASDVFDETQSDADIRGVRAKYRIDKQYILTVGSIEPRKNLARTLVAFKALIDLGLYDYQLVIVGGKGWKNDTLERVVSQLNIADRLIFTGYVVEEDMPLLYQGAEFFVYPSIYEGFGLPVLEAMASGIPVVTSNSSSLPEVAGEAAILVDPTDTHAIFDAMKGLGGNASLRAEMANKGKSQAKTFSWERTARKTLQVYQRVLSQDKHA